MSFVHLHVHSTFSLLDGAIPPEELPHLAAELGFEAVALTDHDALTGAVRFSKACKAAGIKPIYGAELTTTTGHITVLAKDATGYANLCRLISDAHLSSMRGKPMTTFEKISRRAEGLFVFSGCAEGEVARLAASGRIPQAIAAARRWRNAIGENYRIEVFDHRGYGHRTLRNRLLKVAHATGIRAVATNNVHYGAPEQAVRHSILHAIKEIVPLSHTQSIRPNSEYGLKPAAEMRAVFADVPEVVDESMRIAEACDFDLVLGKYHFPQMGGGKCGAETIATLRARCYEGAERRFPVVTNEVTERLEHELEMIVTGSAEWSDRPGEDGFAAYFLLVADIVEHTKKGLGIRCACRGSAAGSLVCYVLGISDVDPVRYDLLFERFMNKRREELPDIDVDVESHRREEVLEYILDSFGPEQTAICCMTDTFRARMAIREVGKALGMPPGEIDVVAKAFPRIKASNIGKAAETLPELKGTNLRAGQLEQLFELCSAIDGFPRHLALHPSGVILSSTDLADRVPMQESYGGFTMLQADKHDVEDLGLVKLDVLGVRMFSAIAHAVDEVERTRGARIELDGLTHDDPKTYELMRTSRTLGCFQIESPGQRDLLARLQPGRFEDLIVEISLFRPGPVKSDMVTPFLSRRHGYETTEYLHPGLREVLDDTNGVIVYHEQLIRAISVITGCTLDEADYIRRHLDDERLELTYFEGAQESLDSRYMNRRLPMDTPVARWFIGAAIENGLHPDQAALLWKEVFAFASFGFCKAHAAAFALPTYISSWLKTHYPAEFYAGLLTHDPGMYPRRLIVADARQFGIPILPIDVNHSDAAYRVEHVGDALGVRLALSEVRDISEAEIDSLLAARRAGGPFDSLEDLWRRAELSRPVLENLVHVGAVDGIRGARSRRELLWRAVDLGGGGAANPVRRKAPKAPGRCAGVQLGFELEAPLTESLPGLPDYTEHEETEAELAISGIDARRHIMELYRPLLAEMGCLTANDLLTHRANSEVWVAGVKVSSQTPAIRSGQRIIFLTLDDLTGPLDVTVFERVQAWCARTAFHSWLLLVKGTLKKRGGASLRHRTDPRNVGITIVAEELFDLAELAHDRAAGHSLIDSLDRQRAKQAAAGLAPGEQPPTRLWHSSGGSAGR